MKVEYYNATVSKNNFRSEHLLRNMNKKIGTVLTDNSGNKTLVIDEEFFNPRTKKTERKVFRYTVI